jgi:uncharacterized secreted protein with C-terminal beta-propeller domain
MVAHLGTDGPWLAEWLTMTIKTALVVLAALTSAAAVGCSSSDSNNSSANADTTKASLHRAKGCTDLLADLKADAKWKLDHSIDLQILNIQACRTHYPDAQCASYGGYIGGGVTFNGGLAVPEAGKATSDTNASAAPSSGAASAGTNSGGSSAPTTPTTSQSASTYSQTNTQVAGVDEADIVKNDGTNIYVLHGSAFKVIHAFPAAEMKESGSINIDGSPSEMFVSNGKVVVYSTVNGAQVFTAAGVKARNGYQDFGVGVEYNSAAGGAGTSDVMPTTAPGTPVQSAPYVPLTKVTVLTLNGDIPVVSHESWYEGSFLDARRVGNSVRTIFQGNAYGPTLKYGIYDLIAPPPTDPSVPNAGTAKAGTTAPVYTNPTTGSDTIALLEKLRQTNYEIIDASTINDWLPYSFNRNGGAVSASTTACEDFYIPTVGSTEDGVTEVQTIDLGDPNSVAHDTAILGRADTVYGNDDSLYLAAHAYVEPPFGWYDTYAVSAGGGVVNAGTATPGSTGGSDGTTASPPPPAPQSGGIGTKTVQPTTGPGTPAGIVTWSQGNTHIHKFEFKSDPSFANYVASGTVKGNVKDQFSLDENNGNLRIATTEYRTYITADNVYVPADTATVSNGAMIPTHPNDVNHVFVLGQKGPWLDLIGDAGDLAPNETIESVRFVDGRGYVTTYRQVDPLFVLDLTNPTAPNVVGQLTIPGFSEYMHPLDANHLLTIGRDGNRNLNLQIFDVTNPSMPALAWNLAYNGNAQSDAEYDHKAFTFYPEKNLLAIPFYTYGNNVAGAPYGGTQSSLEVFHVDTVSGIAHIGEVDTTSLIASNPQGYCGGYYGPSVRRGVFLDSTVYAISYGGIAAKDVGNLGAPATTMTLPAPVTDQNWGAGAMPACYVGAPSAGGAPSGAGTTVATK